MVEKGSVRGSLYDVKRRGRPPQNSMARPKKRDPQTELEKLQTENLRLRAEKRAAKSEGLSRGTESPSTAQWAKAINELRSKYPLGLLLKLRKMARSVFYYHLKRLKADGKYAMEKETIKSISTMSIKAATAIAG